MFNNKCPNSWAIVNLCLAPSLMFSFNIITGTPLTISLSPSKSSNKLLTFFIWTNKIPKFSKILIKSIIGCLFEMPIKFLNSKAACSASFKLLQLNFIMLIKSSSYSSNDLTSKYLETFSLITCFSNSKFFPDNLFFFLNEVNLSSTGL